MFTVWNIYACYAGHPVISSDALLGLPRKITYREAAEL